MKQTNAFLCLLAAIFALTLAACPDTGSSSGGDGKTVQSITLNGTPAKNAYSVGEAFDLAGLSIDVTYTDSTTSTGVAVTAAMIRPVGWNTAAGSKTLTVEYGGKSASLAAVTVTAGGGPADNRGPGLYVGGSTTAVDLSTQALTGTPDFSTYDNILGKALAYIRDSNAETAFAAENRGVYTLVLGENISVPGKNAATFGIPYLTLTITTADTTERTVSLSSNEFMFRLGVNETLILDGSVTLKGRKNGADGATTNNSSGLIAVSAANAVFTLKGSAKLTGNSRSASSGIGSGAVYISEGGTFEMQGGSITDCSIVSGSLTYSAGGVCVNNGTFTMTGGEISGCTASIGSTASAGGVFIYLGNFTKTGGVIAGVASGGYTDNTASASSTYHGNAVLYNVSGTNYKKVDGDLTGSLSTANTGSGWDE